MDIGGRGSHRWRWRWRRRRRGRHRDRLPITALVVAGAVGEAPEIPANALAVDRIDGVHLPLRDDAALTGVRELLRAAALKDDALARRRPGGEDVVAREVRG